MRRGWIATALVTGALLVGGCGVPLDDSANAVPANLLPPSPPAPVATPSQASSPEPGASPSTQPPQSRLRLWFVQEDGLAAVESDLPVGSTAEAVVAGLALGPALAESQEGLRTIATDPLTGEPLLSIVAGVSDPVVVRLSPAFSALPSTEQVLLLGQVVLSLTGAGMGQVAFTDDAGTSVGVPLPDGRLLDVPATARDYNALIVRP